MRFGVAASLLLHLCAIGLLFVSLPESWRPKVTPEPYVPIEIISQAELAEKTSVPAAAPKPKPEVKPEPEPPAPEKVETPAPKPAEEKKPETEAPPPPPEEKAAPEPEPVAPEPAPEKKPEPPKPEPKPSPKPKETGELDLDRLSALVDKERAKEEPPQGAPSETPIESDRAQRRIGAGDRLTASETAKMQAAIARCWQASSLIGAPEPEKLLVQVAFELNRDGTLKTQPRVVNAIEINLSGNKFWKVAEQVAVRAVAACAPYDFLSQDRYEIWKEMQLNFDPSVMAGF